MIGHCIRAGRFMAIVATVAVVPFASQAQSRVPGDSLDLAGAMALARQHAPALRIVDARRDMALGRVRESAQYPNPTIEFRRENLWSTLSPDIFTTFYVPFDITGRRFQLRSAGRSGEQRVDADRAANRRDAEVHLTGTWLNASATAEHTAIARRLSDQLDDVAKVDAVRLREGLVSEAVAMRTQLEADRARVALASTLAAAARARADLSRALGLADADFPPTGSIPVPTLPAFADSAAVVAIALRTRPEVAAREAGVRETQLRQQSEARGMIGDWQLQGGTKKTSGIMTGQLGLALPLPLFNRNDGARLRARGEVNEALALRDEVTFGVRAEVLAAWKAYSVIRANAADVATFASRGREIAKIAGTAYREGHATLLELLDAERAGADAELAQLRWAVEAWSARFELERALAARLDADSPLDLPLLSTVAGATTLPHSPNSR